MSAPVTPVNSWNTPDTVLVNPDVGMHKLIRSLAVEGEKKPYFLTSENSDLYGTPDTIYDSNGAFEAVRNDGAVSVSGTLIGATPTLTVTVGSKGDGWNYVHASVPGLFRYEVVSVVRSDGSTIPNRNAWITDRTFRDGKDPILEEQLHLADDFAKAGTCVYTISLKAKPTDVPEVLSFEGLEDGAVENEIRDDVTVVFSKEIDPATFTTDDIILLNQGVRVTDMSGITIGSFADSPTKYLVSGLSTLCNAYGRYELTVQCAGIEDINGQLGKVGKSVSWTYSASESPYIAEAEGVPARPTRNLDAIVVVTSTAVDPESFTSAKILLNDENVSDSLIIRTLDAGKTRFEISGFEALQQEDGVYTLAIDGADLRGLDGATGVNTFVRSWTRDTIAPVLESVFRETGMEGNKIVLTFSEKLDDATLTLDNAKLTRDGQTVALPSAAKLECLSDGVYVISGFDSAATADGVYEFTVDSSGVADEAGNVASSVKAVSWSVDTTPPGKPTGINVSSEYGSIDTVVQTCVGTMTISGVTPEAGVTVQIFSKYVGGAEMLLAAPSVAGDGKFSAVVNLPENGGAMTLILRITDAAGNSSDTEIKTYYDKIALTAELSGAPELGIPAETMTLSFSDAVNAEDVILSKFALMRNKESVTLDSVALSANDDGMTYALSGLSALCSEDGDYVLTFAATDVRKRSSGLKASECTPLSWRYEQPDRDPPTAGEVSIDGAAVESSYDLAFGRIEIPFSEPVNVPELIANGLITVAVSTDFAYLPSWNAANNVLTLTVLDEKLPRGTGRVVLDPALIKDMAGNELDCVQSEDLAGTDRYVEGLQLAKVDGYAMPTWHDGQLTVGYKTFAGVGIAKTGDQILVSGITGSGCQGVSVCWADWDSDGTEELVVGESNGRVTLRKGATTTEIRTGSEATYGSSRAVLCSFDADGDGTAESVVCGGTDGKFRRLWKQEDGSVGCEWLADSQGLPIVVAEGRSAPVFTDVNHDGSIDLLTGDTKGNVWLCYGTDGAWLSTPVCLVDNSKSRLSDRSRVAYGDVNGDGIGDLIVGRSDGSVMAMLGEARLAVTIEYEIVWPITLGESLNLPTQTWEVGGAAEWMPEWSEGASDGEHCAFIRSLGNNANAWMQTTVDGPGEISFMWMCDLASKNTKLQFFVDDVAQGVVSGSSPWTPVRVTVYGEGTHVLKWRLFTGRSGAVATDVGAVDVVTWMPAVPPTLAEALNADLTWNTSGTRQWRGVAKDSRIGARENWAVASGLGDDETAAIETRVYGNGLLVFDWGVSCEEEYDWMEVSVDGEVKTYITGEMGWTTEAIDIIGEGWHVVRWEYIKDEMDEPELVGDNTAMLDSVLWYSEDVPPEEPPEPEKTATENTPVPVPFAEIEAKYKSYLDAANGDYEAAAMATGKNGYAIWECYVAGLDPENPDSKFTVQIEIVNGKPLVTWKPALNGTNDDGTCKREGVRTYRLWGSNDLEGWLVVPEHGENAFNFFKVEVRLP